jgi:hypothetical protein
MIFYIKTPEKGFFVIFIYKIIMVTVIIVFLISAVISFLLAKLTTNIIKKRDIENEDEPFEFTEISTTTPTPTPVYEKKKSGRKPKTTK